MFDALVDEFRTHTTEWLRHEREQLVAQQRNLRTREMAVLRVLDERGQVDCSIGSEGESARVVRDKVETARALESLPAIAAVAFDGRLSDEQLSSVVRLADEHSDREWAQRAPRVDPEDLARLARKASKPTADEGRKRYESRSLTMRWGRGKQLRANASIELVLVDDDGAPLAVGPRTPALSPKIRRAVLLRDGKCRVPGCARRNGLEVHHLLPRTWGGSDDIANLAVVCPAHHRLLVPYGLLALVGNPNLPDGLELVTASRAPPPVAV